MGEANPDPSKSDDESGETGRGWFAALRKAYEKAGRDNAGIVAAGVAYYAFLAIVPLLAAIVLVYGLVTEPEVVERHAGVLAASLPATAAGLVADQLEAATEAAAGKTGLGLLIALGIALFGARNGAGAIILALNIACGVEEARGLVKRNLLSLGMTLGAIVGLGLVAGAIAVTSLLAGLGAKIASYLVIFAAAIGGSLLLFRYAPNRDPPGFRHLLPGAVMFALSALVLTAGFGIYVANFGNYNATYGSLGAVVVLLTWLYLTAYVLLLGAELNSPAERAHAGKVRGRPS